MQMRSWPAYEGYTGPLGLQTLTDIVGNHYGVAVEASENNGWGQWHRADAKGVGMDRSVATGTGYAGQYRPAVAVVFESMTRCPDDLLLFFHHVPYTYVLHSGKTVIQSIYDSHYAGEAEAERFVGEWQALKGRVDDVRYAAVLAQLQHQAGRAEVWRDAVSNYFLKMSGIADAEKRVGHYPGRMEAESMTLTGYAVVDVAPWEAASGGKAISCAAGMCAAGFRYSGAAGWYDLRVQYFDQNNGAARYRLFVAGQLVDEWVAGDRVPTRKIDGSSSTRRLASGIALRPGDEIRIEGMPDGEESAALDYVEVLDPGRR
jgi:alpha-glucuronidase